MKPSDKSPELEAEITRVFEHDRRSCIEANRCVPPPIGCGQPVAGFRDEASRKEYTISGLCQDCQDKIWVEDTL